MSSLTNMAVTSYVVRAVPRSLLNEEYAQAGGKIGCPCPSRRNSGNEAEVLQKSSDMLIKMIGPMIPCRAARLCTRAAE